MAEDIKVVVVLGDSEASDAFLKGTCRLGVVMITSLGGGEHKRSIRTVHSYLRKVNSKGMDEEIPIKYLELAFIIHLE